MAPRRIAPLILAACLLAACVQPGTVSAATQKPLGEMQVNSETSAGTIQNENLVGETAEAAAAAELPAAQPEGLTKGTTIGFESMIAAGLKARWAGKQAIVVRSDSANGTTARVWLYEYTSGAWRAKYGPWRAVIGKNGMGKTAEGDGKSPVGAFLLGTAFGTLNKPTGMTYNYRKLDSADRWVDAATTYYNRWVRGGTAVCGAGENLSRISPQYRYAVAVRYNDQAKSKGGSAIFLHVWKSQTTATAGCTAMSEENMLRLLRWLDYAKRPVLIQGTEANLKALLGKPWGIACLPAGWCYADDFIPDLQPDVRYFTTHNFTGARITGYNAPELPMRMNAVTALANVASELRKKGYGIRVFDAYRSQAATDAMVKWAQTPGDATKAEYYPDIPKSSIVGKYIARKSNHRLGGTVDLTVLSWATGKDLDMGGRFDFFGERSHYDYNGLTAAQRDNRALLRSAMTKAGFTPLATEWWHFSYAEPLYDGSMAVQPREFVLR